MNGKQISQALNHLPDEMIREAMESRKAIPWKRITAVAATLAILLTALLWPRGATSPIAFVESPGILKAYACEADETDKLQQKEYMLLPGVPPSYLAAWSPIVNLLTGGIRLTLITDEESLCDHEITYDISVNYGELYGSYHLDDGTVDVWGKSHIATNKETIRWLGNELYFGRPQGMYFEDFMAEIERIHLDVIIKADDNIVGYAIFEITCTNYNLCIFSAALVESVYFPKVDGVFQNVPEGYIRNVIAEKMARESQ